MCYDFAGVEKILKQCAHWRESITETPENLQFTKTMAFDLNLRKDLWNHYEITFQHVRDWKNVPFKKVFSLKNNYKL